MWVIGGVTIGGNGFSSVVGSAANTVEKDAGATKEQGAVAAVDASKPAEGVSVTFSGAALKMAAEAKKADQSNSDIEESGPDKNIQEKSSRPFAR